MSYGLVSLTLVSLLGFSQEVKSQISLNLLPGMKKLTLREELIESKKKKKNLMNDIQIYIQFLKGLSQRLSYYCRIESHASLKSGCMTEYFSKYKKTVTGKIFSFDILQMLKSVTHASIIFLIIFSKSLHKNKEEWTQGIAPP